MNLHHFYILEFGIFTREKNLTGDSISYSVILELRNLFVKQHWHNPRSIIRGWICWMQDKIKGTLKILSFMSHDQGVGVGGWGGGNL